MIFAVTRTKVYDTLSLVAAFYFHSIVFWSIFIFFIVSLQTNCINNVKSNI